MYVDVDLYTVIVLVHHSYGGFYLVYNPGIAETSNMCDDGGTSGFL